MNKRRDPREITESLLDRSACNVQVAAVIVKEDGDVHAWGWNSSGAGFGEHAEAAAVRRANKRRLRGSMIYVASQRKRNSKTINSKPCEECQRLLDSWGISVVYRNAEGEWLDG